MDADLPTAPTQSVGDDEDRARLAEHATALITAVEHALQPWIQGAVDARYPGPVPAEVNARVEATAAAAVADIGERLRTLLALDIDEQWTNPLAIIRGAVSYPTAILADAGVAPIDRDVHDVRLHPDDVYGLSPAAFEDLGPDVREPGLMWGAAKAHVHLRRRREGEAS